MDACTVVFKFFPSPKLFRFLNFSIGRRSRVFPLLGGSHISLDFPALVPGAQLQKGDLKYDYEHLHRYHEQRLEDEGSLKSFEQVEIEAQNVGQE